MQTYHKMGEYADLIRIGEYTYHRIGWYEDLL